MDCSSGGAARSRSSTRPGWVGLPQRPGDNVTDTVGETLQVPDIDQHKGTTMSRNEGTIDRVLRVLVGLALISLVFIGPATPWGWVGLILVVTGLIGFCPIYALLGMRTCAASKRN